MTFLAFFAALAASLRCKYNHKELEFAAQNSRRLILDYSAKRSLEQEESVMSAFITGGTCFIGKRLVRRLLQRDAERLNVLMFNPTAESVAALTEFWGE